MGNAEINNVEWSGVIGVVAFSLWVFADDAGKCPSISLGDLSRILLLPRLTFVDENALCYPMRLIGAGTVIFTNALDVLFTMDLNPNAAAWFTCSISPILRGAVKVFNGLNLMAVFTLFHSGTGRHPYHRQ